MCPVQGFQVFLLVIARNYHGHLPDRAGYEKEKVLGNFWFQGVLSFTQKKSNYRAKRNEGANSFHGNLLFKLDNWPVGSWTNSTD
jgi:hypothetical protein